MKHEYQGPERREGRDSWMEAIPPWARAIGFIGIPGAIALFLVWAGANDIPRISREVEANQTGILYVQKLQEQQILKTEQTYRLLQRICSNTAKTDIERQRCFDQ